MPRDARTVLRFLIGGGLNTLATLLLYWLLLRVMPPQAAYAASYATGLVLSWIINTRFVFDARRSWQRAALFPLVYLVAYLAGAGVLQLATTRWGIDPHLAPFAAMVVTLPLTFVLMRLLLERPAR